MVAGGQLLAGQQVSQASSLIGKNVNLIEADNQTTTSGVVDSVQIQSGVPFIMVGGVSYDLSQVTSINPTPATP